jgi:hypothetical protein
MFGRRRNQPLVAAWIATLLAFFSNFLFFRQFAGESAVPWLGLALFAAALVLCAAALRRAFGNPQVYRGKVAGSIVTLLACLLLAVTLFAFYVSRNIPGVAQAPQAGDRAPEFLLTDSRGVQVSLSSLLSSPLADSPRPDGKPKAVLLVFYRGYW